MITTGDQQLVKRINRSVLLRQLRATPGASRAQLAESSGLTKSTVSLLVRELIDEGWLSETDGTKPGALGRPSTPLQYDANKRALIGVEVAVEAIRVVGISLTGQVLWALEEALNSNTPNNVVRQTARLVSRAHAHLVEHNFLPSGLGVGVPGAVDEACNEIAIAANLGWRKVPFQALLQTALNAADVPTMPVHIQNEADTAAISEYEFAEGESQSSLIFVTCGVGLGAGIVLNDRLFTGTHGGAGEIGHSTLQIDGTLCSCGRRGCAETLIGARTLGKLSDPLSAGKYLGVVLQNLWMTFEPSAIVVGGPSCQEHPDLIGVATATLGEYARCAGTTAPQVRVARYGLLASAVGAAALVLHKYLRPMHSATDASTVAYAAPI
jgi:predicted NBD/HSP70 family sugar kinase